MNATTIWTKACDQIMQIINKSQYEAWFATLRPLGLERDTLLLGVNNDFKQTWIEENYRDVIASALQIASGGDAVPFRFVVSLEDAGGVDLSLIHI